MTTADPRLLPKGHLLDSGAAKYRIIKKLGRGGFGITYLATDEAIGLQVAIKEFYPHTVNGGAILGHSSGGILRSRAE